MFNDFVQKVPVRINNWSGKIELNNSFNKRNTFTSGIEILITKTNNNSFYGYWDNSQFVNDINKSNYFLYTECIGSAYSSFRRIWSDNLETTIGLRAEYYYNKGRQQINDENFANNYIDLFPTLFIGFKNKLTYSLTHRIRRPSFSELNPFKFYISAVNYVENNPFLKPSNSINQELSYLINNKFVLKSYLNLISDDWAQFSIPLENGAICYRPITYGKKLETGIIFVQNMRLFNDFWSINNSISYFYVSVNPNIFNGMLKKQQHSVNLYLNNSLLLSKKNDISTNISFYYNSPYLRGNTKFYSNSALNFNIRKQFKKINLLFWINDLYNGSKSKSLYSTKALLNSTDHDYGSRSIGISLIYNWGNRKVISTRNRSTSNDNIKKRAG